VAVHRALRESARDEQQAKEAMRFGGRREGEFAHSNAANPQERRTVLPGGGSFFGVTVATCERGDVRQSPNGLFVYSDEGKEEIPVERRSASRSSELQELYDAVIEDRPVFHDGRWGMATLEVCLAIMQSGRERREILLQHQSATSH
jgi:predicted dehydrogenase